MIGRNDEYDSDALLLAMVHNRQRKEIADRNIMMKKLREEVISQVKEEVIAKGRAEGLAEGRAEGIYDSQREITMQIFQKKHPNVDVALISHLTLEQYKEILNLLIQDASLEESQAVFQ